MQETRFDFLRELVKNIPDMGVSDDGGNDDSNESPEERTIITTPNINLYSDNPQDQPINLSCNRASTSRSHLNGNGSSPSTAPHTPTATSSTTRLPSTPSTSVQQYSPYSLTSPTSTRNSGNYQRNIHHQQSLAATDNNNDNIATMRLKRQWQNVKAMRGQIVENDSSKLLRTNSTPTDLQMPTTPNQRSRGRTRTVGLPHQPRSVPTTPLTPIVRVDFDKEPIIKIDFTNTNLHDNSQSSSTSLSAACRRPNQSGPSTAGADLGPVVNIDLSNFAALTTSNNNKIPTATTPAVTAAPSSSILELDEDYDNI